jgi:hypothetical protein
VPEKDGNPTQFIGRMYAVSTLIAVIIAVPAVVVAVVTHFVLKTDIIITLGSSMVAFFIAMGFGIRIARRFAKAPQKEGQ